MNVAVVSSCMPFERGAVDEVADELSRQLLARGHSVERVRIPVPARDTRKVLEALVAIRFLHIRLVDLVIALDFPACFVRHPRTVVWAISGRHEVVASQDVQGLFANAEATFLRDVRAVAAADRALADRMQADLLPLPREEREWAYTIDRLVGYAEQRPRARQRAHEPLSREALALLSGTCNVVGATMATLAIEPTLPVVSRAAAALAALGDAEG
jgi:hypothetical protein